MTDQPVVDYAAFRAEVRAFLQANLPDEIREATRLTASMFPHMPTAIAWQKILHRQGWAAPHWPEEFGGPGWDLRQQAIFREEQDLAGAPSTIMQGLFMCGPVLMGHGTKEQQDHYLARLLSAEHIWCQGYSEPASGSDLASLKMAAVPDGDDYILNGSKIWTSNAHEATHMFCLVRTSTEGKPQQGITFLLLEMDTPGITVEPIINLNGVQEQCQVFFDDVRVPQANRVGAENDGWTVAKYLLEFERSMSYAAPLKKRLRQIRRSAAEELAADGTPLIDDRVYRRRLAAAEIDARAFIAMETKVMEETAAGGSPGPAASVLKIAGADARQALDRLWLQTVGTDGVPLQPEALVPGNNVEPLVPDHALTAMATWLDDRSTTIAGGSAEVQRSIVAKAVLGL